jgi:chemotaxis response regulator CheB
LFANACPTFGADPQLQHLSADMGVAIVIVDHLRAVATRLHEILPRYIEMPVEPITEGLLIQPDRVFIIPARRDLHVLDGEFHLKSISKPRGWPDVITVFLRSFTGHWNGKLIAVIVSGYDGDGAEAAVQDKRSHSFLGCRRQAWMDRHRGSIRWSNLSKEPDTK